MPLASGTRLGPYEILGPLGAGDMGEVYVARDTRLDRSVAIKVLPREYLRTNNLRNLRNLRLRRRAQILINIHLCRYVCR
ncbi:MAG: hypothetical protein Q7R30_21335 [Acidobacteriota bacterium]|nr:hypothetical protein [Acidobacteriota bacterium]